MKRGKNSFKDDSANHNHNKEQAVDDEQFDNDRKRIKKEMNEKFKNLQIDIKQIGHFDEVSDAFEYLRQLCKQSKLVNEQSLPPIVWRHQLYSLFENESEVDYELDQMSEENLIRVIYYDEKSNNDNIIIKIDDYIDYYTNSDTKNSLLIKMFVSKILKPMSKTYYDKGILTRAGFHRSETLKLLTELGMLTKNDNDDQRQLSFGGLGIMVRALNNGYIKLLNIIKKCKYSQILQSELVERCQQQKPKELQQFPLEFHFYDLYGRIDDKNRIQKSQSNLKNDPMIKFIELKTRK